MPSNTISLDPEKNSKNGQLQSFVSLDWKKSWHAKPLSQFVTPGYTFEHSIAYFQVYWLECLIILFASFIYSIDLYWVSTIDAYTIQKHYHYEWQFDPREDIYYNAIITCKRLWKDYETIEWSLVWFLYCNDTKWINILLKNRCLSLFSKSLNLQFPFLQIIILNICSCIILIWSIVSIDSRGRSRCRLEISRDIRNDRWAGLWVSNSAATVFTALSEIWTFTATGEVIEGGVSGNKNIFKGLSGCPLTILVLANSILPFLHISLGDTYPCFDPLIADMDPMYYPNSFESIHNGIELIEMYSRWPHCSCSFLWQDQSCWQGFAGKEFLNLKTLVTNLWIEFIGCIVWIILDFCENMNLATRAIVTFYPFCFSD